MRISSILIFVWCSKSILVASQYHGNDVTKQDFDLSVRTKIPTDSISSTVLRRSSGSQSPDSGQGSSRQRNPRRQRIDSTASSRDSSLSQHGNPSRQRSDSKASRRDSSPSQNSERNGSTAARTDPDNLSHQSPMGRVSRPVNRNTGTLRDLVRSASPPQVRERMRPRLASSSPPAIRRIQLQSSHFAHPSDPRPAQAVIGMTGPGIISHQWPPGHFSPVIVPHKKSVIRGIDHPTHASLGGRVFSQGQMLASASGVKATSSFRLGRGHGIGVTSDPSGKQVYNHGPHSEGEYWMRRLPWHTQPVSAEAHTYDQGSATVVGCNDPNWCNHIWEGGRSRRL